MMAAFYWKLYLQRITYTLANSHNLANTHPSSLLSGFCSSMCATSLSNVNDCLYEYGQI